MRRLLVPLLPLLLLMLTGCIGGLDLAERESIDTSSASTLASGSEPGPQALGYYSGEIVYRVNGFLPYPGSYQFWRIRARPGTFVAELFGPPSAVADFDLYIGLGHAPTLSHYACWSGTPSSQERCELQITRPVEVYMMIRSVRGIGRYELSFRYRTAH